MNVYVNFSAAAAVPPPAPAPSADRLEQARVAGPSTWVHQELVALRETARAAGVEQHELLFAMLAHAVAMARPDEASRAALASVLVRDALKLDPDAVRDAVERGRWKL